MRTQVPNSNNHFCCLSCTCTTMSPSSSSDVILGYNWLQCYNPNVDWLNSMIKLNHCPMQCLLWQKCLDAHLAKNGIWKIQVLNEELAKIKESMPEEFWEYADVFSEVASTCMPLWIMELI